jgi:hypothetical protein
VKHKRSLSPEAAASLVTRAVAALFALFLIMLSDQFNSDLGSWMGPPARDAARDAGRAAETALAALRAEDEQREAEAQSLRAALDTASRDYAAQKEVFDNWLRARGTIGSPDQDPEVLARVRALDEKMAARGQWSARLDAVAAARRGLDARAAGLRAEEQAERTAAESRWRAEEARWELKVFALRMGVALPILALGVLAFVRWRRARYAALAWGYIIFSGWVFFVGVVPYLPSFGGYLRFAVGAALTAAGGVYATRGIQAYAERRRRDLLASSAERARRVSEDAAVAAHRERRCPSCDHDWTLSKATPGEAEPSFCWHCGLRLHGACPDCGTVNFVHFNHCKHCGRGLRERGE